MMVILRTHIFEDRELLTAASLTREGIPFAVAADETRGHLDIGPYHKISVTGQACKQLGLYCPKDFTWRNGDYALYLAQREFPQVKNFWLIESDVEHSFPRFADFLALFGPDTDLLSSYLRPAEPDWFWHRTMKGQLYRSLFPLIRLSARAIDVCLERRKRERLSPRSLLHWPNDEVFVATTVLQAGLKAADFNSGETKVYDEDTFRYEPLNGDELFLRKKPRQVFHPVLYGDAYRAKVTRLQQNRLSYPTRARLKLQAML